MSTTPTWETPAGSLGTIPEGVFYSVPLIATADGPVFYSVIAGNLPPGIQIDQTGVLSGNPEAVSEVQGVPADVSTDTISKFAVRAYTKTTVNGVTVITGLADRTFTLTITGLSTVVWTTPSGRIATYFDGKQIADLAVEYSDSDIAAINVVTVIAGALPPGLTISSTGVISGYVTPNPIATVTSTTYSFTLRVTNGISSDTREFNILVYARSAMTSDNTFITADNTFITADISPVQTPIILTPQGSIGSTRSDNFYAFQFTALDFSGNAIEFTATTTLPPGLTLDPISGWIYGYIPFGGVLSEDYRFSIVVSEIDNPTIVSEAYDYRLTISGPINSDVIWLTPASATQRDMTPSNLGLIDNGDTSTFYVAATNVSGLSLQYELLSGSDSRLPQGLQLLSSGNIVGRVSFDTFCLDSGATTFDVDLNTVDQPTTFDLVAIFTVRAYSFNGLVSVNKTFSITVVRRYEEPYNNIYIQAMPPQDDRSLLDSLLQNPSIFSPELIYRADDPYFGVARRVVYNHAYGLTAATLDDYVASLELNHYWKNLVLGEIKTAQARDDDGNIIYEVVYSEIVDNLVNDAGESVDKQVVLPFPINANQLTQIDSVYPNSLQNMRDQVIDTVGQVSRVLPRWMLSRQSDGSVLGFTPAWVIAYTMPGQSGQIAYNIQTQFGQQLNLVDFDVDRYELDRWLTKNWDSESITLDINTLSGNGNIVTVTYATQVAAPALPGATIVIAGVTPSVYNGIYEVATCTTSTITFRSRITNTYISGGTVTRGPNWIPQPPSYTRFDGIESTTSQTSQWINNSLNPVAWINNFGQPSAWTNGWNGEQTVFDANSLEFIEPVDMYVGTVDNPQQYDKYLVFPKRNILE